MLKHSYQRLLEPFRFFFRPFSFRKHLGFDLVLFCFSSSNEKNSKAFFAALRGPGHQFSDVHYLGIHDVLKFAKHSRVIPCNMYFVN